MDNNYVFVYTEGAEDLPTTSMLVRLFSTLEKAQAFMRERVVKYLGCTPEQYKKEGGKLFEYTDYVEVTDGAASYIFFICSYKIDEE